MPPRRRRKARDARDDEPRVSLIQKLRDEQAARQAALDEDVDGPVAEGAGGPVAETAEDGARLHLSDPLAAAAARSSQDTEASIVAEAAPRNGGVPGMPGASGMPGPNSGSQATTDSALHEMAAQVFKDERIADKLADPDDIELKTRLNPELAVKIGTALLFAQEQQIPELAAFCYKLMELRVSLLGEGRKEIVEVSRGGMAGLPEDVLRRMKG